MSFVTEYLDARGVPYEVIHHDPSVSSLEEAGAVHVDADHVLKAVRIATRGGRAVAVIPASRRLDMHRSGKRSPTRSAYLATEDELQSEYPLIELGGAPALGWLLDAETLVDPCVLERDTVVFAAGTRTESVRVQTRDLFRGEHAALRSARGRTGDGRDERTMNGGQPDPIRRIVVGVDGSDGAARAVAWSARLARATGAEVVAAHAIESPAFLDGFPHVTGTIPTESWDVALKEWREHTRELLDQRWCRPLVDARCPVPGRARSPAGRRR